MNAKVNKLIDRAQKICMSNFSAIDPNMGFVFIDQIKPLVISTS